MTIRKSHIETQPSEWKRYVDAVTSLRAPGPSTRYADFVNVHVQAMTTHMEWQVHSMPSMGMVGVNFLTWHRWFLHDFERLLQQIDAQVFIPYWDWQTDQNVPSALADPGLLQRWGVNRSAFDARVIQRALKVDPIKEAGGYAEFQTTLEALHGSVHNAFNGDMRQARSPNDPVFWLHHANVDRLWYLWQGSVNGTNPPNMAQTLMPAGLFGVPVSATVDIASMNYSYAPAVPKPPQLNPLAFLRARLQPRLKQEPKIFFDVDDLLANS